MNKVICVYVTKNKCISTTAGNIESNDMNNVFKYFTDVCNIPMEDMVELYLISNGVDGPETIGYWITPFPWATLLPGCETPIRKSNDSAQGRKLLFALDQSAP